MSAVAPPNDPQPGEIWQDKGHPQRTVRVTKVAHGFVYARPVTTAGGELARQEQLATYTVHRWHQMFRKVLLAEAYQEAVV